MAELNIQIFGTLKCSETKKAERFFSDRKIKFHFRDLNEKGIAKGELDNISRVIPVDDLIDREGKQFRKRNMEFMKFNVEEELLKDALLFKTPIVRYGREITLGYAPEVWKKWISS